MAILAPTLDMGAIRSGLLSLFSSFTVQSGHRREGFLFFFQSGNDLPPPPSPRKPTMEWNESLSQNAQGAEKKPKQAIVLMEKKFKKESEAMLF